MKTFLFGFSRNTLLIGFLVSTAILFLNFFGLNTLANFYTIRLALFFLAIYGLLNWKEIYTRIQTNKLLWRFATALLLLGFGYVLSFILFNFGNPFQFKNTARPDRLGSFAVFSQPGETYSTEFLPELNHLGAVDLYFRPIVDPLITEDEEPLTAEIVFEEYFVEVYRDDHLIHSHNYPIPTLPEPHVYPVGFPIDTDSASHRYLIRISHSGGQQPRQEIATRGTALMATPQYVINKSQALKYAADIIDFFEYKSRIALSAEVPYLLLVVILSIIFLFSGPEDQKKKLAKYLLLIMAVFYSVYLLEIRDVELPKMLPGYLGLSLLLSITAVFWIHSSKVKIKKYQYTPLRKMDALFILLVLSVFVGFATQHLGQFISVDEPKWLNTRVPQLYDSIKNLDFAGTYINDKPGVLPAALAGLVNLFTDREAYTASDLETYLFYWRLPIVIFNAILLPLMYWLILQLHNRKTAQLGLIIIAAFPQLIGISQIVNPDATVWSVGFVSALFFLLYIKSKKNIFWFLSGVFMGLALLSKFIAVVLYYGYFFTIIYDYLSVSRDKKVFVNHLWTFIKLAGVSVIFYFLLFPATWIQPALAFKGTIATGMIRRSLLVLLPIAGIIFLDVFLIKDKIYHWLQSHGLTSKVLNFLILLLFIFAALIVCNSLLGFPPINWESFKSVRWQSFGYSSVLLSIKALVLSIPAYIVITFALIPLSATVRKNLKNEDLFSLLLTLLVSVTLIFGASFVGIAAGLRYQAILLPFLGLGLALLLEKFPVRFLYIFSAVLIISLLSLIRFQPFYLPHTNILNTRNIQANDLWGFGGYELAQKLNSLPGANNLVIWFDREGVNHFFIGKSYWRGRSDPFLEPEKIDYLVLSRGGENIFRRALAGSPTSFYYQVGQKLIVEHDYYGKEPELEFCVRGVDCYWAVKFEHSLHDQQP